MTDNSQTCQKCGSPVTPGMKFCESCGAKIEALSACPQCGAAIGPDVKFCEVCGAPVSPAAVPVKATPAETAPVVAPAAGPSPPEPETPPVLEVKPPTEPPVKAEKITIPVPVEKPAPAPDQIKEPPQTGKVEAVQKENGPKKPISRNTMIVAGIIVIALLGAAVYFVVLPMFSGSGGTQAGSSSSAFPGLRSQTQNPSDARPSAVSTEPSAAAVSFVTEPTQVPPANLLVAFQVERDPITGLVTVTFSGGAGRNGVQDVFIRLTRSDGQVMTRTITLSEIGQGATLQGTRTGDDRIEVTANYYNGEHYKIIDQILEYKKRDW